MPVKAANPSRGRKSCQINKKCYLNVVGMTIRANRKARRADPNAPLQEPITVRTAKGGKPVYGDHVHILDAAGARVATLTYRPDQPLGCGAVVYVVAEHGVEVEGGST